MNMRPSCFLPLLAYPYAGRFWRLPLMLRLRKRSTCDFQLFLRRQNKNWRTRLKAAAVNCPTMTFSRMTFSRSKTCSKTGVVVMNISPLKLPITIMLMSGTMPVISNASNPVYFRCAPKWPPNFETPGMCTSGDKETAMHLPVPGN